MKFIYIPVLSLLVFAGCANTEIYTFRTGEELAQTYSNLLLVIDFPNSGDRYFAENAFVKSFKAKGLDITTASEVMSNIRERDDREVRSLLSEHSIDGILVITPALSTDKALISGMDKREDSTLTWCNRLLYFGNPNSEFFASDEELYTDSWGKFTCRLYDAETGERTWVAVSTTNESGLGDFEDLMTSNSETTVEKLVADNIIRQ